MGRAIVRQPQVFLFDEPLSNLDAKLRAQTRLEIQKLHRELGVTSLFAVDASACFSRPGPRLVDGVEILAAALHPEVCPAADVRRLVRVQRG